MKWVWENKGIRWGWVRVNRAVGKGSDWSRAKELR